MSENKPDTVAGDVPENPDDLPETEATLITLWGVNLPGPEDLSSFRFEPYPKADTWWVVRIPFGWFLKFDRSFGAVLANAFDELMTSVEVARNALYQDRGFKVISVGADRVEPSHGGLL